MWPMRSNSSSNWICSSSATVPARCSFLRSICLPTRWASRSSTWHGNVLKRSENMGELELPAALESLPHIRAGREDSNTVSRRSAMAGRFLIYSVPLRVAWQHCRRRPSHPAGDGDGHSTQPGEPLSDPGHRSEPGRWPPSSGRFLARRALAPIDTITNTASTITQAQDLGQRIQIADSASEVGRLAGTFNDMLDRIQELFQAQERLIGDVSHELRTPLTTIQGNIDLLQRMGVSPIADANPRAQELNQLFSETLGEVQVESERMSKMISDLLLLAQADSGALQLQMGPVEVDTAAARRLPPDATAGGSLQGAGWAGNPSGQRGPGIGAGRPRQAAPGDLEPGRKCSQIHASRRQRHLEPATTKAIGSRSSSAIPASASVPSSRS